MRNCQKCNKKADYIWCPPFLPDRIPVCSVCAKGLSQNAQDKELKPIPERKAHDER